MAQRTSPVVHLELHTADLPAPASSTRGCAGGRTRASTPRPAPTGRSPRARRSAAAWSSARPRVRSGCPTWRWTTRRSPSPVPPSWERPCCSSHARAPRAGEGGCYPRRRRARVLAAEELAATRPVADPVARAGPEPRGAVARVGGRHRSSDRHPQPMHSVSPRRRRSSSTIRSSIRVVHFDESRDQSRLVGARSGGSFASSPAISSRLRPMRWAKTMKAIRRNTERGYRRWPEPARSEPISSRSS